MWGKSMQNVEMGDIMKTAVLVLFVVIAAGCASENKLLENSATATTVSAPEFAPDPVDENENQSKVLNKSKKCPKNAKLVNGKCTMQVESND